MDKLIMEELKEKYGNANSRLILLDYDGTLVNYTPIPHATRLSEHLFDILIKLVGTLQTQLFIITGRSYQDIDKILYHLPVDIIAEHGAMIKESGIWKNQLDDNGAWRNAIIPVLNHITLSCPNSFVEEKSFSLAWHYRNAESQSGFVHSRKLISILEKIMHLHNLKILDGNKVVEIMIKDIGKGNAVKKLYDQDNYDFILVIGDDATDEEMFEYFLPIGTAFTIKVGNGDTCARYKLPGSNEVALLLKHLSV